MKFTIVVDVEPDEFSGETTQEVKDKIKANIENNVGAVDSIGQGDQSNIGWYYVTRWHEDDFAEMLAQHGVHQSEENIDTLMYACRHMDDRMVEAGWNYMDWVVRECDFEPEFKCEVCGEEITEEDNNICESCREELETDLLDEEDEEEEE